MRLKHVLYICTLLCAFVEIGMALYAMHWSDIMNDIAFADHSNPDSELVIVKALNIVLPVGVLCIFLLLYTWKIDSIGGVALFFAVVMHLVGTDLNVRAMKKVYGAGTPLASVTWWIPSDKDTPPPMETGEPMTEVEESGS